MKCETCNTREFVHADIYCNGCSDKPELPKPRIKKGRAYLFKNGSSSVPICSIDIEATEGQEYEVAAVELMRRFRIEFEEVR